jgi:hypothetical protein
MRYLMMTTFNMHSLVQRPTFLLPNEPVSWRNETARLESLDLVLEEDDPVERKTVPREGRLDEEGRVRQLPTVATRRGRGRALAQEMQMQTKVETLAEQRILARERMEGLDRREVLASGPL